MDHLEILFNACIIELEQYSRTHRYSQDSHAYFELYNNNVFKFDIKKAVLLNPVKLNR